MDVPRFAMRSVVVAAASLFDGDCQTLSGSKLEPGSWELLAGGACETVGPGDGATRQACAASNPQGGLGINLEELHRNLCNAALNACVAEAKLEVGIATPNVE